MSNSEFWKQWELTPEQLEYKKKRENNGELIINREYTYDNNDDTIEARELLKQIKNHEQHTRTKNINKKYGTQ